MKKLTTFFLAFIIILSGCSNSPNKIKQNKNKLSQITLKDNIPDYFIPYDIVISSVGDSLTEGIGDSTNSGGYVPYLKTELENNKIINKVELSNFGVKGNRTDQLLKKLENDEIKASIAKSDIVIVTIGGNDVMKVARENFLNLQVDHFSSAENHYKNNLHEIVRAIRNIKDDVNIILVGLYNPFSTWFADVEELDEIINNWNKTSEQTILLYKHTHFVNIADIFEQQGNTILYNDNFHPNNRGYELIANRIKEKIITDVMLDITK